MADALEQVRRFRGLSEDQKKSAEDQVRVFLEAERARVIGELAVLRARFASTNDRETP